MSSIEVLHAPYGEVLAIGRVTVGRTAFFQSIRTKDRAIITGWGGGGRKNIEFVLGNRGGGSEDSILGHRG